MLSGSSFSLVYTIHKSEHNIQYVVIFFNFFIRVSMVEDQEQPPSKTSDSHENLQTMQ